MKKPNRKDFYVDSGLHSAMSNWAESHNKARLELWVQPPGEEAFFLSFFDRWLKQVSYIAHDKQTYSVYIQQSSFNPGFLESYSDSKTTKSGASKAQMSNMAKKWLKEKNLNYEIQFKYETKKELSHETNQTN